MADFDIESTETTKTRASKTDASRGATALDKLRERVAQDILRPEVYVEVPERPGVYLRVSPNITQDKVKAWRRASGENSKDGIDTMKFSALVIGSTTTGIMIDDVIVQDEKGNDLTFVSEDLWTMVGASRSMEAVVKFFGIDFHVDAAAIAILEQSGLGEDVNLDPSKRA